MESGDDLIDIVTMFWQLKEYAFEKSTEYFRVIFKVNGEDETATIQADVCKNRKNASRNIEFILVQLISLINHNIFSIKYQNIYN